METESNPHVKCSICGRFLPKSYIPGDLDEDGKGTVITCWFCCQAIEMTKNDIIAQRKMRRIQ